MFPLEQPHKKTKFFRAARLRGSFIMTGRVKMTDNQRIGAVEEYLKDEGNRCTFEQVPNKIFKSDNKML